MYFAGRPTELGHTAKCKPQHIVSYAELQQQTMMKFAAAKWVHVMYTIAY